MVEYHDYPDIPPNDHRLTKWIRPKLNSDNTIIIHPLEEKMYSQEEE